MVAALFRNFLLADRIMRHYSCHPISFPSLPETHNHPMWEAWDLAADHYLSQLPEILSNNMIEYKLSSFFADQLSAFEVWIQKGAIKKEPPQQLPIVLQVLLSQVHRLRALLLLGKFLDFGQWAVNLALSVGIFPYVLKLLQSPAIELRPVLVFIWAKILAVDQSCRNDLLKDNGYNYFITILNSNTDSSLVKNISEHRAMCVFILSVFCHDFSAGKQACFSNDLIPILLSFLNDLDPLLRQWSCLCLLTIWTGYSEAKRSAINLNAHMKLFGNLADPVPEVRASALAALGALFGDLDRDENILKIEDCILVSVMKCIDDGSPLVRKELADALSDFVNLERPKFLILALEV
jgi:regulator-associated protein of mTOR